MERSAWIALHNQKFNPTCLCTNFHEDGYYAAAVEQFGQRHEAIAKVTVLDLNAREELRHMLSTSGPMAGLCITAATLCSGAGKAVAGKTVVDDIFVLSALIFLLCTYCVFWALRTKNRKVMLFLTRGADVLFAIALTAMVSAGFIMTYTLW